MLEDPNYRRDNGRSYRLDGRMFGRGGLDLTLNAVSPVMSFK